MENYGFGVSLTALDHVIVQKPNRKVLLVFAVVCALGMMAAAFPAPAVGQAPESPSVVQSPSATYSVLYSFVGYQSDGAEPNDLGGALVRDAAGNLYGSTQGGGHAVCQGVDYQPGTIFELNGNGTESCCLTSPTRIAEGLVGRSPTGAVVLDLAGNIYGTTQSSGPYDGGTVFKLSGGSLSTLYNFGNNNDPSNPYAGVILDRSGNIYGTAPLGGASGCGSVYEINTQGAYSDLYTFTGGSDGCHPYGGLAMDLVGNLFGMTYQGGANYGTVYEISRSGGNWTETTLHTFAGPPHDGGNPQFSSLALQTSGPLIQIYGVTDEGGSTNNGVAFKMARTQNGYSFTVLHNFTGTNGDGALPYGTPLLLNGKLFGTTEVGGSNNWGTVFELSPGPNPLGGWMETILYNFTGGADGGSPLSGLLSDSSGAFYGVARDGGIVNDSCSRGCGVIFKVQP